MFRGPLPHLLLASSWFKTQIASQLYTSNNDGSGSSMSSSGAFRTHRRPSASANDFNHSNYGGGGRGTTPPTRRLSGTAPATVLLPTATEMKASVLGCVTRDYLPQNRADLNAMPVPPSLLTGIYFDNFNCEYLSRSYRFVTTILKQSS